MGEPIKVAEGAPEAAAAVVEDGGGVSKLACIDQSARHLNGFVLPALVLLPKFEFAFRLEERAGDPGILTDGRERLTREINGVGQLLAIHQSFDFTKALLQQLVL